MAPPVQLPTRRLGKNGPEVAALGFGAMGLSVGYGSVGTDEERLKVLDRAWELGATNWDTADVYADSEDLIGKWFALHPERRSDIFLATKFGLRYDSPTALNIDSSPEYCAACIKKSLKRLGVDYVDLYYAHRLTESIPVEKTIAAMAELQKQGLVRHLGISECSGNSLRRACKVAHIAAVQVEYNPWDLAIEGPESGNLLAACRELGVAVVCYSPLGRGIMTGAVKSRSDMEPTDFRLTLPRYSEENFHKNLELVAKFEELGKKKGCTSGQLALAWLLKQGDDIIPIPGTKRIKYLEENVGSIKVELTAEEEKWIREEVEKANIQGHRSSEGFLNEYADTARLEE